MYIEAKENFPVKNLTSFKIGGAVEKLYFPKNRAGICLSFKNAQFSHYYWKLVKCFDFISRN